MVLLMCRCLYICHCMENAHHFTFMQPRKERKKPFGRYKFSQFTILSTIIIRHIVIVLMYKFDVFFSLVIDLLQQSIILFDKYVRISISNQQIIIVTFFLSRQIFNTQCTGIRMKKKVRHNETEVFQFLFIILILFIPQIRFIRIL